MLYFFLKRHQEVLKPNCPPGQRLVDKPEGYRCIEDIRRNRYQNHFDYQTQRNGKCNLKSEFTQFVDFV